VTCVAAHNRTVRCEGDFMPSEGLCLRHAVLFDFWIADGGWRAYDYDPGRRPGATERRLAAPTIGPTNPPGLRRWKRAQFHAWLDRLTPTDVEAIMNE